MTKEEKNLRVFGYGLAVISMVFAVGGIAKHGLQWPSVVMEICFTIFLIVAKVNYRAFGLGYFYWMKVAHAIAGVVTLVICTFIFFAIFVPVGLVLRLIGKDHLSRRMDPAASTYWIKRTDGVMSQERYRQQF